MKKLTYAFIIILALTLLSVPCFANGSVAGHIYSTDILTFVNGRPIDGYNTDGKTVVIAEDLDGYGFGVEYNDETRTLKINSYFNKGYKDVAPVERGQCGKILGDIYKTDIKVYYNGIIVTGYNIGGRTAVCLEDLGDLTDSPNADFGYSQYLGKALWNADERTISYESYMKNEEEILGVSRVYHRFKDNVIYTFSDDFYMKSEFSGEVSGEYTGQYTYSKGTGASRFLIKPLYFDNHGVLEKIGLCVQNPNNTYDEALMYIEDVSSVREMIKTFKSPKKSHDEAIEYFKSVCVDVSSIENEKYTVLKGVHQTEGLVFVYINKDGGYVVDTFVSGYADRTVECYFTPDTVRYGPNTVTHTISPFAGPHGATTMSYSTDLDTLDYE